ncbi:ChbG/HpnK family deacetylase [Roseibium sp.]|uniref:ChbG/HpnK family deacetylase n=1 Tax=Roseibium sp. TaxID=1936156 RepID=UPI003A96D2A4
MKKITLGALDYGLAFGVDRTLRSLLQEGRLSAVGCLVASELWPREFKPLKDLADELGERAEIGLTLALSGDHVTPVSQRMREVYGDQFPARSKLERLAMMRLLPDEMLIEEICQQVSAFTSRMDRLPRFVALREGLLDRSEMVRLVLSALDSLDLKQKPWLVAPSVFESAENRFLRMARKAGYLALRWGPPVPEIADREELFARLRHHFDFMDEDVFVATLAGEADNRLRRQEPLQKVAIRECQGEVLGSDRFFRLLDERDIFLN